MKNRSDRDEETRRLEARPREHGHLSTIIAHGKPVHVPHGPLAIACIKAVLAERNEATGVPDERQEALSPTGITAVADR